MQKIKLVYREGALKLIEKAFRVGPFVGLVILVTSDVSHSQSVALPGKPITIISPYSGGGTTDFVLRTVARKVEADSKVTIVIESRTGGAGTVAANALKASAPDGTVMMLADVGPFAANVTMFPNLSYDPIKDFKPVTTIYYIQNVVAVPIDSPVSSMKDLVDLARTKPGGLNYSSPAVGASGHLLGSMFAKQANVAMTHIAYRGALPAATEVVAGRIDFCFCGYSTVRGFVEGKKLKLIALSAKERDPLFPDLPTVGEQGFPELHMDVWFGLVAPNNTPDAAVDALNAIFVAAIKSPEVAGLFREQAVHGMTSTPAEFQKLITDEIERYRPIVEESGAIMK